MTLPESTKLVLLDPILVSVLAYTECIFAEIQRKLKNS